MLNRNTRRLVVSIDEIRTHSRELADGLLNQPFDYSQAFDRALKNIVNTLGNRPAFETAEETVRKTAWKCRKHRTDSTIRCTIAHTSAVSDNSRAILAHSHHSTSTTWCLWKASSQNARSYDPKWSRVCTGTRQNLLSTSANIAIRQ